MGREPKAFLLHKMPLRLGDPGMTRTCDLRFRKPSLYPAELRDRSPADSRGRLKAPYQSGRVIASLCGEPVTGGASRYSHGARARRLLPYKTGSPGMPESML